MTKAQTSSHDHILILDFGSQVTQLIARRLRESGVYCEIWPFNQADETRIKMLNPRGIILSGGPSSVLDDDAPAAPEIVFKMGVPVFGICYGQQTMVQQLGGSVEADVIIGRVLDDVQPLQVQVGLAHVAGGVAGTSRGWAALPR